jgi:hypothetical protein
VGGPLESFSEGVFRDDCARLGGEALKQRADVNAGIPDRLCWLPTRDGRIVWFWAEWKRKGLPPQPHQAKYHERLRARGHLVYVFDDNNHAREVMRGLIGAI